MLQRIKKWFTPFTSDGEIKGLRNLAPVPLFWLFGKTQSGKTSLVKFLTGAEEAEIGQGWQPCTRFSRQYRFPTAEATLFTFLDTRGVDEPGYDPAEDLAQFNDAAHVTIVTVKVLDFAQENVLKHLRSLRKAQPARPNILILTCLHEAYPQQQHPEKYPFQTDPSGKRLLSDDDAEVPSSLRDAIDAQCRLFEKTIDRVAAVDLTPPAEGFHQPNYGGEQLKETLLEVLPAAYRQTLLTMDAAKQELQDYYSRRALPRILAYSGLAASAGAFPIPWVDLLALPAIQTRMITELANLYGQPLSGRRFLEIAGTLGLGLLARQAIREVTKFIPVFGSVAGAALAGSSTFALGQAFCYYYRAVLHGHIPKAEDLKRYYHEQLKQAEKYFTGDRWAATPAPASSTP